MPRFVVEREFPQELDVDKETAATMSSVGKEAGAEWIFSFLSADKKRTYCLYEAADEQAVRDASSKLNLPVGRVTELTGELRPDAFE